MIEKLFALASVSALAGIVSVAASACSASETSVTGADSGAGTPDGGKPKPPDGGGSGDDPDPRIPPCTPITTIDVSGVPYTAALTKPGACTADEVKAIDKFLDDAVAAGNTNFKQSEWAATVSKGCADCVFTAEDAPKWGPILNAKDDADEFAGYSFGACVEIESGKEGCGRAYHQLVICQLQACNSKNCKDDDQAPTDCLQDPKIQEICKAAVDAVTTECGQNLDAYVKACPFGIEERITSQCVSPKNAVDAGDGG